MKFDYVVRTTACTALMLVVSSCSFSIFSSDDAVSLNPPVPSSKQVDQEFSDSDFLLVSRDPYVFKTTLPPAHQQDAPQQELFFTAIEDCSVGENVSKVGAARQLFIGLSDLQILEQEEYTVSSPTGSTHKGLRSVVSAKMDSEPLSIMSFSLRRGECVRDYVAWKAAPTQSSVDGSIMGQAERTLFQRYLDHVVPDVESHENS